MIARAARALTVGAIIGAVFGGSWWGFGEGSGPWWHAFGVVLTATAGLGASAVAFVLMGASEEIPNDDDEDRRAGTRAGRSSTRSA